MAFKLYGYERNPRSRIIQIVATAEGIELELHRVVPRQGIGKEEYEKKFPISTGKIPGLEGPGIQLTETLAIVTFLARYKPQTGLLGSGSLASECEVLMWMSWANQELLQTLARWFLPLIPSFTDPAPYSYEAVAAGKAASLRLLDKLEDFLAGRKYLVGNEITLADIMVAIYVSRGLEWVLDAGWRSQHPAIMAHFNLVAQWNPVKTVVPDFIFIEKETPNRSPKQCADVVGS
ncbi:glutathione S-transferase [Aspergillus bertholletiae]|uniref:Glutathione S-transferase n=1 Tax=Aspergillus bertholletiae TaxID=1226010 RepID=A0A5N7AV80_9EURO|nr:glutathione S-transferase [Aspergillus bertholletiae]